MVATLNNQLTYRTNDNEVVDLGEGRVSVRVRLLPPFSENTGGGLFFRGSLTSTTYLAFYRKAGRAYSLCKIVDGKLENIWTHEISQIDDKEFCQLSISGCGNRIELSVDAAIVFAYTCKSIHGPTVGVSVLGTGLFEFDDFAMYSRR